MKSVDAGQFAANISQYLQDSLGQPFVLPNAGKPCAVVQGLDHDDKQTALINSAEI
jgi:hypothetical protein